MAYVAAKRPREVLDFYVKNYISQYGPNYNRQCSVTKLSNLILRGLYGCYEPTDSLCYIKGLAMTSEKEIWSWRNAGKLMHNYIMGVRQLCIDGLIANGVDMEHDQLEAETGGQSETSESLSPDAGEGIPVQGSVLRRSQEDISEVCDGGSGQLEDLGEEATLETCESGSSEV